MRYGLIIWLITVSLSLFSQEDITPPVSPEIERVRVDTVSGLPVIHWKASSSDDVEKYTMFYIIIDNLGNWYPLPTLDTVDGETRQYTYTGLSSLKDSVSLTLTAIDTAGEPSLFSDPHTTIFLTTEYDSCTKTMTLDWTPYVGWTPVRYEIYASTDNGEWTYLAQVEGEVNTYDQHFIVENHRYCYFIEAVRAGNVRSTSNITCREVSHALHPQYIDLEYASVDSSGANLINLAFFVDPSGEVDDFQLYRARPGTPYAGMQSFMNVEGNQFGYADEVVGTDRKFHYKLYSLDVCLNPVTASNVGGNIVLNASAKELQSMLSWNAYEDFEAGTGNYHIYRITHEGDNNQQEELIETLPAQDTNYTDELGSVTGTTIGDDVCYYVIAEEGDGYSLGSKGYSRSNNVCVSVVPEILMPNAFTPNGDAQNDYIKPVLTYIPREYLFQVFDRWGAKVFETRQHDATWDGRIKGGAKATEGVYVYFIRLTTTSGIEVEQKGLITVIYP